MGDGSETAKAADRGSEDGAAWAATGWGWVDGRMSDFYSPPSAHRFCKSPHGTEAPNAHVCPTCAYTDAFWTAFWTAVHCAARRR